MKLWHGRDGRVKKALDRELRLGLERVRAAGDRWCMNNGCRHRRSIPEGSVYARLTFLDRMTFGYPSWPEHKDYHLGCVPENARHMVSLFVPKGVQQTR